MSLTTLFRRARRPTRQLRPKFRARLELLENRLAPAGTGIPPLALTVTNLNDSGAGSLRDAIQTVEQSTTDYVIVFAAGLERQDLKISSFTPTSYGNSAFFITSPVTILGSGQVLRRTSGTDFRLFTVVGPNASLTLENLELNGGVALDDGTGDGQGGAVLNVLGTFTAQDCVFNTNDALGAASPGLRGGNGLGGAIYNSGGTVSLYTSTFFGNIARGGSGSEGGNADGGAVYSFNGYLNLVQCTIANNTVVAGPPGNGGPGMPGLTGGAGVEMQSGGGNSSALFVNNIIANNTGAADVSNLQNSGVSSLDASRPNLFTTPLDNFNSTGVNTSGVKVANPLLGPLAYNGGYTQTMALEQNSPALQAGSSVSPVALDQRGAMRAATPDLGAYEVNHPLAPVGVPEQPYLLYGPHPWFDPNNFGGAGNDAYIKGLYNATLFRPSDPAGNAYWLTQMGQQLTTISAQFLNSTENLTNQVTYFYTYFLGREPDTAGLNFWVTQVQTGKIDIVQCMTRFILSPEYTGKNDNGSFVNTMYYSLLGRASDSQGFAYWKAQLDSGSVSRDAVLRDFLFSQEGLGRLITADYGAYLHALPDSSTLASWTTQLATGQATFGQMAASFLGSPFFANVVNGAYP